MKKIFFTILATISFFFSGCKTVPVEKKDLTEYKYRSANNISPDNTVPELKIYFPSFMTKKHFHKEVMIQGDGTVIILPDGKCIVIDAFDPDDNNQLNSFLHSLNIKKIDYLFASHNHLDHIGGIPELLDNFEIGHYFWNGVHFDTNIDKEVTEKLEELNIETSILKKGDSLQLCEAPLCTLEVLWPELSEQDIYDAFYNPGRTQRLKNNTSLVFKITYNDFSVLFTGDIYKQVDRKLVELYGDKLQSTILKVPHHGDYYTASSPEFLKAVSPDISVILDSRYVNFIISSRYRKIKTNLLYRKTGGYILINSNGKDYNVSQKSFIKS